MEILNRHNIFLGLKFLGIIRTGKLCYQAYTQVYFENEGLCVCAPKCWDSLEGDAMVDKVPSMENLVIPSPRH